MPALPNEPDCIESRDASSASPPVGLFHSGRLRILLAVCVGAAGLVLTVLFTWLLATEDRQMLHTRLNRDQQHRIEAIRAALNERLTAVNMMAAFFAASQLVERTEFQSFHAAVVAECPGALLMAWAPRVPAANRKTHEEAVRNEADGSSHYEIRRRDTHGEIAPADQRSQYYPILFAEPLRTDRSLIGLDLGSDPALGAAVEKAATTGQAIAVVHPPLDDNETDRDLLYVIQPSTNRNGSPRRSADQPEADGVVLGAFRIGALVESSLNAFPSVGIDIYIKERDSGRKIYTRLSPVRGEQGAAPPEAGSSEVPSAVRDIEFAGSRWTITCVPMASYLARQRTWGPIGAALAGVLVTGLLVGYSLLLTERGARVQRLVSERTRKLYESEGRFRRLVENAGDAFFLHDQQGRIIDVNRRACESLGYARDELLSMTVYDLDPHAAAGEHVDYWNRPYGEYPVSFQGEHRRKDGTTFPVEIRLAPLDGGQERLMLALARDITDRRRAEQALCDERQLLRDMLDLQERDRRLVAYEIHDGLAQQLTGALFQLQAAEAVRDHDPPSAEKALAEGLRLLREAMAETRRLISDLRPYALDDAGIVAALDHLVAQSQQPDNAAIELVARVEFDRLAAPLESAIFRIVQECLTNACRHSQSRQVCVEISQSESGIRLEVRDDGIGFDPDAVSGEHFGLRGIRERARLLGGTATIESAAGKGTRIRVEFPLLAAMEDADCSGDVPA